jgi:transcription elongation factor GreA
MKDILLTKEGIEKMKNELKQLIEVDRKEIIRKIKETRELGDLSENAEYDAARNQQSIIEGKIEELESILKNAKVIDSSRKTSDKITIGSKVVVEMDGTNHNFTIVSSAESDPSSGLISDRSPLGQALVGAKVGDQVSVDLPEGDSIQYKIVSVN